MADKFLIDKAKTVLNQNYQKKGFTIPSKNLYPFQWKWDSGFIAIGFAHFDMEKAKKEINSLLNAQWKNALDKYEYRRPRTRAIAQALIACMIA